MDTILIWLIPAVTPVIIAGLKQAVAAIPRALLPWLAPVVGMLADIAVQASGLGDGVPLGMAALLGAAGVGIREASDQAKQALT